ncbi:unnamed protein product, partial [Strongylus vulgaris]
MEGKCPPMLHRSANLAIFLSGSAFIFMVVSMPVLFTVMNNIEEELMESRVTYEEMSNLMWKDLQSEAQDARRSPRQASYNAGTAPLQPSGGNTGAADVSGVGHQAGSTSQGGHGQSCPAGPKGAPGAKGIPGQNGLDGKPGRPGSSGNAADAYSEGGCPPCPAGPPGLPGYKGMRGPRGPKASIQWLTIT